MLPHILQFRISPSSRETVMQDRRTFLASGLAGLGAALGGCASTGPGGWTTLLDGAGLKDMAGLSAWSAIGAGNWSVQDGTVQGKNGKAGFLVSQGSYADFELRAEFWADAPANSGIFLRCQDRNKVQAENAYEVNIFDQRPDPSYGTGAIVDVVKVAQPGPRAADRWNTYEITARGDRLVVVLNGVQTAEGRDPRWPSGPIALQSAAGTIRFRKLQIRVL
jgi:hypothetical protein